jgi:membrane protein
MKMKVFKFDVDEAFAKQHNEMLRDSRRLLVSGLLLGGILLIAGILVAVFVQPIWSITVGLGLGLFGIMMAIVGVAGSRKVGTAQQLYDRYPLAPAVIAKVNERDMVIMALVNSATDPNAEPRPALALRTVSNIPGLEYKKKGAQIPVAAVTGRLQRNSSGPDTWAQISPMPIAWGTPDPEVVRVARTSIPHEQWAKLQKNIERLEDVQKTRMDLLHLD